MNVFVSETCYRQVYGSRKGSSSRRVEDFNRLVERLQDVRTREELQVKGLGTKKYRSVGADVYGVDLNNGLTAERVIFRFLDPADSVAARSLGRYTRPGQVESVLLCYCSEHDAQHRNAAHVARTLQAGAVPQIAACLTDTQLAELRRVERMEVPWRTYAQGDLEHYGAPRTPVLTEDKFRIVADFLSLPGPMLVTGAAGSGKTELGLRVIGDFVRSGTGGARPRVLYITASARLLAEVEARCTPEVRRCCDFMTLDTLLRSLSRNPDLRFSTRRSFLAFARTMRCREEICGPDRGRVLRLMDARGEGCVYAELYGVVFGGMGARWDRATAGGAEALLPRDEYLALPDDVGYLSCGPDREAAYCAARHFLAWLRSAGLISRNACAAGLLGASRLRGYDLVVADEVQDLSDVQVELLRRLSCDAFGGQARLFMTGDVNQVLAPTAFDARRLMRMDPALVCERLQGNFRNPEVVCEVANGVGRMRAASTRLPARRRAETSPEESFNRSVGRASWCVCADEDRLVRMADEAANVALVTDGDHYARLRAKSSSVFTVEQVKGMEFCNVILYGLMDAQRPALEALYTRGPKDASLHRCLNLLYVGVTRSCANLLVVEPAASPSLERFVAAAGVLEHIGDPADAGFDLDASAAGYFEVALALKEQGAYASARDNFARALAVGPRAMGGALDERARAEATRQMRVCETFLACGPDAAERDLMRAFEREGLYEEALPHAHAALDGRHVALNVLAACRGLDGARFSAEERARAFEDCLERFGLDLPELYGEGERFDGLLDAYCADLADDLAILALETRDHTKGALRALRRIVPDNTKGAR